MPRPRKRRCIRSVPKAFFYKPHGVSLRQLEIVELSLDEYEALRLKNVEQLDQTTCAQHMNISQSTFQRILTVAMQKVSTAIVQGKAIRIAQK
ncbi:MAG: hypothetical protein CR972_03790 [Candidatus Moraniibacteriota bacterium]|nr:MAG: hypothetical protein CR972_03790 [Candidatus Moranbacteria bacterium]